MAANDGRPVTQEVRLEPYLAFVPRATVPAVLHRDSVVQKLLDLRWLIAEDGTRAERKFAEPELLRAGGRRVEADSIQVRHGDEFVRLTGDGLPEEFLPQIVRRA